jgi:hypothetical protein
MEADYIALSQSMRELIPILREVVLEMQKIVFAGGGKVLECESHSKIYEQTGTTTASGEKVWHDKDIEKNKLPISTVYEDNTNACLKFATAPKMSLRGRSTSQSSIILSGDSGAVGITGCAHR